MGTNYYMIQNTCEHCGRGESKKHIGKSSGGWCFSLRVYPEDDIDNLDDWKKLFHADGITFKDEYGDIKTECEVLSIIEDRSSEDCFDKKPYGYDSWGSFHALNGSEEGPNGLLRHRITGGHCVGHGDGTFDYICGEFC